MILTLQDRLIVALVGSNLPLVSWTTPGIIAFNESPEPPPAFPYLVLEVPESSIQHTMGNIYAEKYTVSVYIIGEQPHVVQLASPASAVGITQFLEQFQEAPQMLSGDGFECDEWLRKGWHLAPDQGKVRAPGGGRVWVGTVTFDALLTLPYRVQPSSFPVRRSS